MAMMCNALFAARSPPRLIRWRTVFPDDAEWSEMTLASYVLWRLNWIHPFIEGNGRTARAACYYIICTKYGGLPGGKIILPERIRMERAPYYEGLSEADRAWERGELLFPKMEQFLARLFDEQILDMEPPSDGHDVLTSFDPGKIK